MGDLINYLSDNSSPIFNDREPILQALNVVFGSMPSTIGQAFSPGGGRHYPLGRDGAHFGPLGGGLEAFRGYFQSARPATGGLLLNVNITHGVFLEPILVSQILGRLGSNDSVKIQKKLKYIRVAVQHLPIKPGKPPRVKTIWGLARPGDGSREDHVCYSGASST